VWEEGPAIKSFSSFYYRETAPQSGKVKHDRACYEAIHSRGGIL